MDCQQQSDGAWSYIVWYVYMSRSSPRLNPVGNLPESKEASGPSSTRKTVKMIDVNVVVPARRRANDDDARVECCNALT